VLSEELALAATGGYPREERCVNVMGSSSAGQPLLALGIFNQPYSRSRRLVPSERAHHVDYCRVSA
jgi:hypothetical protein